MRTQVTVEMVDELITSLQALRQALVGAGIHDVPPDSVPKRAEVVRRHPAQHKRLRGPRSAH